MLRIGRLHWVLDVSMDEDRARNRKGNGAACLAVVRRLAPNIARMHPDKRSIRRKGRLPLFGGPLGDQTTFYVKMQSSEGATCAAGRLHLKSPAYSRLRMFGSCRGGSRHRARRAGTCG